MPDGGTLTIETRSSTWTRSTRRASRHQARPVRHARVRDTGVGMDEAIRQRIFEPFFTTKAYGKGTGLGLSMVYGIVKQSGGNIWFHSEPGHGTSFTIYLPYVTGSPTSRAAQPPAATARGHETVLVVEDELPLRELAARVLAAAGYTVLQAGERRRRAGAAGGARRAGAPGLHRRGHARHERARAGRAPGEAASGDPRPLHLGLHRGRDPRHGVLDDPDRFLSKPYTPSVLRRRIREALDG